MAYWPGSSSSSGPGKPTGLRVDPQRLARLPALDVHGEERLRPEPVGPEPRLGRRASPARASRRPAPRSADRDSSAGQVTSKARPLVERPFPLDVARAAACQARRSRAEAGDRGDRQDEERDEPVIDSGELPDGHSVMGLPRSVGEGCGSPVTRLRAAIEQLGDRQERMVVAGAVRGSSRGTGVKCRAASRAEPMTHSFSRT